MHLLLALAIATTLTGGTTARTADGAPRRVTVTLGNPRVISVESAAGWIAPGEDLVAPVPLSPGRFEIVLPSRGAFALRPPLLDTI